MMAPAVTPAVAPRDSPDPDFVDEVVEAVDVVEVCSVSVSDPAVNVDACCPDVEVASPGPVAVADILPDVVSSALGELTLK